MTEFYWQGELIKRLSQRNKIAVDEIAKICHLFWGV